MSQLKNRPPISFRPSLRALSAVAVLAASLVLVPAASAQDDPETTERFSHLTTDDGLVSNIARAVHQSDDGTIWVGTLSGLSRYDGTSFINHVRNPDDPASLPDNVIAELTSDAERLYIGTVAGGLASLNFADQRVETLLRGEEPLPGPANPVSGLVVDDGALYIGTEAGLLRMDLATGGAEPVGGIGTSVTDIALGSDGTLWIGTRNGLQSLEPASGTVETFVEGPTEADLSSSVVTAVAVGSDNTVWVGTETAGVNALDPATGRFRQYRGHPGEDLDYFVLSVIEDSRGQVWTNSGSRLYRIDPATGASTKYAHDPADPTTLGPGAVLDIIEDRDGLIWVAKQDAGLARLDPTPKFAELFRVPAGEETAANSNRVFGVSPVVVDGVDSAVVSTRELPMLWNLDAGTAEPFLPAEQTCGIHAANPTRDTVWCVGDKVQQVDLATGSATVVLDALPEALPRVWSAAVDVADGVWLGGPGAVAHVSESGEIVQVLDADALAPLGGASSLEMRADGMLVAGHWGTGVAIIDPDSGDMTHLGSDTGDPESPGLTDPTVFDVATGVDGELLVATNGGLDVFAPDLSSVARYNTGSTRIAAAPIRAVAPGEAGHAWVAHDKGLALVDLDAFEVVEFTADDGLQSGAFSPGAMAVDSAGRVLAGGAGGLNRIVASPTGFERSSCSAPPTLSIATAGDQVVHNGPTASLSFAAGASPIELVFQQSCYVRPDLAQLRYRVSGDEGWHDLGVGQYTLIFPELAAGDRTIEVQAADRLGGWVDESASLSLSVAPAWFRRGWVQALAALAVIGLIAAAWWFRSRQIRATNARLEHLVDTRTSELQVANRRLETSLSEQQDLMDVVAHDLRAPVVRQMMHLGMGAERPVIADSRVLRRQVEHMDRLLNRLMRAREVEVGLELEAEPLELGELVEAAVERAGPAIEGKGIDLSVELVPDAVVFADRLAIEEIFDNLLDNAIKYSFTGGRVSIVAFDPAHDAGDGTDAEVIDVDAAPGDFVAVRFIDEGVGISAEDLPKLFKKFGRASERPTANEDSVGLGLFSVGRLADQLGGEIRADSEGVGKGVTMTIVLPTRDPAMLTLP